MSADFLIVSAMPQELLGFFPEQFKDSIDEQSFPAIDNALSAVIMPVGWGKTNAAINTVSAISLFKPKLAIMVGIAGILDSRFLKRGDLCIVQNAYEHDLDCGKFSPPGTTPRDKETDYYASAFMVSCARRAWGGWATKQLGHIVRCATGDQLIDSNEKKQKIISTFDTETNHTGIVDMETAAFYKACNTMNVPSLAFRIGTDEAEGDIDINQDAIDSSNLLAEITQRTILEIKKSGVFK